MALMGGTIVTWLQNTLKLAMPSLRARGGDRGRGRRGLEADREEHNLSIRVLLRLREGVER